MGLPKLPSMQDGLQDSPGVRLLVEILDDLHPLLVKQEIIPTLRDLVYPRLATHWTRSVH